MANHRTAAAHLDNPRGSVDEPLVAVGERWRRATEPGRIDNNSSPRQRLRNRPEIRTGRTQTGPQENARIGRVAPLPNRQTVHDAILHLAKATSTPSRSHREPSRVPTGPVGRDVAERAGPLGQCLRWAVARPSHDSACASNSPVGFVRSRFGGRYPTADRTRSIRLMNSSGVSPCGSMKSSSAPASSVSLMSETI